MSWEVPGYVAEDLIGFGAHGEVWRGRELATGDVVALKRLRASGEAAEHARVGREAAMLAAFRHPHVLRLRCVLSRCGRLVLVLDYAARGSLGNFIARRGPLQPGEVAALLGPIAAAIGAAHAIGLVHGAVSARNVLLTADGRPLLADLGTAGLLAERPVGPGSDVYALAALAVQALTGSPVGDEPITALRSLPETHPLAQILRAALHANPDARPPAAVLAASLRAAAASGVAPGPIQATVPPDHPPSIRVPGRHRRDPASRRPARPGRRIVGLSAAAAGVVVAGVAGLVWLGAPTSLRPAASRPTPVGWSAVWAGLDRRRAQAFASADATLLGDVYLPGCPALPADLHAVRALAARRAHATGVVHELLDVRVEGSNGLTVTLLVTDRMQGYDVRDAAGHLLSHAAPRGDRRLRVRLARTSGGWRISDLGSG